MNANRESVFPALLTTGAGYYRVSSPERLEYVLTAEGHVPPADIASLVAACRRGDDDIATQAVAAGIRLEPRTVR